MRTLIQNATIVDDGRTLAGDLTIYGDCIESIDNHHKAPCGNYDLCIDATGCIVMPGVIDSHVHFREPGLTAKADIESESRAAAYGGVTTFFDMPNTVPQTVTQEALADKWHRGAEKSHVNYSFFPGATNDNLDWLLHVDPHLVPGIKLFMGSSTGNMLVDREEALRSIFQNVRLPIVAHCEDTAMIGRAMADACERYGDDPPVSQHPVIRSAQACMTSSSLAVALAREYGARLHLAHLSTAQELSLLDPAKGTDMPSITGEAVIAHLMFSDADYATLGTRIKCNPAVKTAADREALREAVASGVIDTIGSDHAPHLPAEKARPYRACPSGMPTIQESFSAMLTLAARTDLPLTRIAALMSENAGRIFGLQNKGKLAPGYDADLVIIDPNAEWTVGKPAYKCGWTPYEGMTFTGRILQVWLRGEKVVENGETLSAPPSGQPLAYKPIG